MLRTIKTAMNISVSSNANWFIYYLKQIPLIGKLFKDTNYFGAQSKKNIASLLFVFIIIKELVKVAFLALLSILIPIIIAVPEDMIFFPKEANGLGYQSFLYIYFVLYLCSNNLLNCFTLEPKKMKFICVKLMHMDAYEYSVSTYFIKRIGGFLASLPTVIGLSLLLGGTINQGILLCILSKFSSFIGESFHLFVFHKWHKILQKNNYYMFGLILLSAVAAYVPVFMEKPLQLQVIMFHPLLVVAILVLGTFSVLYILRYPDYKEGINESNKLSDMAIINVAQVKKDSRFADVKLKEKQFSKQELSSGRFNQKNGFDYLNALFFDRHKRQIITPVLRRIGIIFLVFVAGVVATYQIDEFTSKYDEVMQKVYPSMIFIMYFLSLVVQRATRAMFYNCDISLLHYGFYKKDNALLKMFWLRLKYLARLNLLPAIAIAIFLWILTYLNNPKLVVNMIPIIIFIIVLSLFFTIHHVFLYYILQPFTTELGMKSPAYNIINGITYMICWACLQINTTPAYFMMIVMIATIIYIIMALVLVSKFANRTFCVK